MIRIATSARDEIEMIIFGHPVPAVRTTQRQKFKDERYEKYHEYKNRIKAATFEAVYQKFEKFIQILGKVRVSVKVYIYGGIVGDVDNYLKTALDGLQLSQFLKNDKQVKGGFCEIINLAIEDKPEERMEILVSWEE